ncbi:hypothetical protein DRO26_01730 [Candidatus Bathyarchaeota archaeon]|nr:MAG: hypothetical protein DRO26_01730 [Candidatus Bathyarchaeota archaeon]
MSKQKARFYCRKCKKIVEVYECYREVKVFPEIKPEFDVVTWCCSVCNTPIIEVSEFRKQTQ